MKVVQFGAGSIGRGFLSPLYRQSGYEIVYVDIDDQLVALLNRRRSYPLVLVDSDGGKTEQVIDCFRAVSAGDIDSIAHELADADIAAVSVGASKMVGTAPSLAAGIARRAKADRPLDILLCENLRHPSALMREPLAALLSAEEAAWAGKHIGLVDMVVGRMVPKPTAESLASDPLRITAEPHGELLAARDSFKGEIPRLFGMETVEPIDSYFTRKLYTLNTAHATLAYLGYPKYRLIWECIQDRAIRETVEQALKESAQALIAEFGFDQNEMDTYCRDILRRLANPALGDTVARVAADPLRKLAPDERLVGPASLCERHGIAPAALARAIDAALSYNNPSDPASHEMQRQIKSLGRRRFLEEHCHIEPHSLLAELLTNRTGPNLC